MSDELTDLKWAKVKIRAAVRSAARFANEEDRIDSYVAALAEPLRQSQRVEAAEALVTESCRREHDVICQFAKAEKRIEELEAALRRAISRCHNCIVGNHRVYGRCSDCKVVAALLDAEDKP